MQVTEYLRSNNTMHQRLENLCCSNKYSCIMCRRRLQMMQTADMFSLIRLSQPLRESVEKNHIRKQGVGGQDFRNIFILTPSVLDYTKKCFFFNSSTTKVWIQVLPSDSISGIEEYEYWPTNYRRFVLQEFYSFDRNFNVQIRKLSKNFTKLNHLTYLVVYILQYLYTHYFFDLTEEYKFCVFLLHP